MTSQITRRSALARGLASLAALALGAALAQPADALDFEVTYGYPQPDPQQRRQIRLRRWEQRQRELEFIRARRRERLDNERHFSWRRRFRVSSLTRYID